MLTFSATRLSFSALSIPFQSLPLRRCPLTTLGRPPPTAVAESQWGEPRSRAFGTGARVAWSISSGPVLLPLVGNRVGRRRGRQGRAGVAGLSFIGSWLWSDVPYARFVVVVELPDGGDVLLVTYMDHGVIAWNLKTLEIKWHIHPRSCKIGCSAVSPNEKILAVTNLYDGIDWYSLNSNHFMDASFQHTTTHTTPENVILPITFVHGNSAVLSGMSYGCARITAVKDWALVEKLRHDSEDIVQALAYSSMGDTRQIVTGVAEKGAEMVIRYWAQQSGSKKPMESKSRAEGKLGWAYLATHKQVSTIAIIITFSLAILLAATKWDQIAVLINWTKDWSSFASEDWSSFASEDSLRPVKL
ncbi:hypothetical protein EDB83DRAFT_2321612 [Lactarius deliciosus]|nr:hypothetical protein EDB83DRAFT_2321612 [Lactarius deliciosus]